MSTALKVGDAVLKEHLPVLGEVLPVGSLVRSGNLWWFRGVGIDGRSGYFECEKEGAICSAHKLVGPWFVVERVGPLNCAICELACHFPESPCWHCQELRRLIDRSPQAARRLLEGKP